MDKKVAYKFGFLLKFAEQGLDYKAVKEASTRTKAAYGILEALGNALGKSVTLSALGFPLAGGVGLAGGYGLGKLSKRPDQDDEIAQLKKRVKNQELAALYRLEADRAKQKAKHKRYRESRPTPPRQPQLF